MFHCGSASPDRLETSGLSTQNYFAFPGRFNMMQLIVFLRLQR